MIRVRLFSAGLKIVQRIAAKSVGNMHTSLVRRNEHEYAKVNISGSDHSDSVQLLCTEHIASDPQYSANGNIAPSYYDSNNDIRKATSGSGLAAAGCSVRDGPGDFVSASYGRNGIIHVNKAAKDPIFLEDRCLDNLLKSEEKSAVMHSYFTTVQKEITPEMRRIVVEWMMEVCEEQKCQEEVVLLALNYMDRFLAAILVGKTHLQILATSCLLLASKLREPSCRGLSADLLVLYTDNSIVKRDLLNWELYVLSKLKWDLSCVTPLDFLELLLSRLPITSKNCPDISKEKVRQHSQAFIWLTAKEHCFSEFSASTIAASSIAAALSGLNWHLRTGTDLNSLLNRLTDLIGVEQEYLRECMNKMECVFREHSRNILSFATVDSQQNLGCSNNNNCNKTLPVSCAAQHASASNNSVTNNETDIYKREAGTPTDVQDLKF